MMVISLEEPRVYRMQDQGKSEQMSEYCDAADVSCWNLECILSLSSTTCVRWNTVNTAVCKI